MLEEGVKSDPGAEVADADFFRGQLFVGGAERIVAGVID